MFLPALCVADRNNINALVTAITYQRYVYGISLPAVGICLYKSSRSIFARVVVGWIDGPAEGTHLPPVRLVTSDNLFANDPSKGVYDMLSPLAALLLSQFVLSVGSDVDENVTTCCIQPVTAVGDCKSAIASWVRDVSISVYLSKVPSSGAIMSLEKAVPKRSQRLKTSDSGASISQQGSSTKSTNLVML
jgi:hypothetical protein